MASREGPYSCGAAACGACAAVPAVAEGRSGVDTGEGLLRGTGSAVDAVDVCAGRPPVLLVSASSSDDDDEEHGKVPTGSLGNICRGSRTTPDDIWAAVVFMLLLVIGRSVGRLLRVVSTGKIPLEIYWPFFLVPACRKRNNPAQRKISIQSPLNPLSGN